MNNWLITRLSIRFFLVYLALSVSATACDADETEPLQLSWLDNHLTIRGQQIPGGELVMNYIEAYCRPGSTDRDWQETVIPHRTELISLSPNASELRLRCHVRDGVVVDHQINTTQDEVTFLITANNSTDKASEMDWGQPCLPVDKFTGRDKTTYIDKCFFYRQGQLVRLPTQPWATQARYTPGQVWAAPGVNRADVNPRPLNPETSHQGLMGCYSADESMQLAIAFEPYQELFQGIFTCIHSDFRIGGIPPGQSRQVHGKLYLIPSNADELWRRYLRDFPNSASDSTVSSAWTSLKPCFDAPEEFREKLGDFKSPLIFDNGSAVKSADDWPRRRQEILDYWHAAMGPWPKLLSEPRIEFEESVYVENFTRHKVRIEVSEGAFDGPHHLLIPDGDGPFPAVVVTWYNSVDSAGLTGKPLVDFGYQLAQRGFVALCIGGTDAVNLAQQNPLRIQPLSYLAYTAANCSNLLASLPQVDANRIGIIGHSFGGKWAMFASCLHERFACAVWVDPGIVWNEKDPNANYWEKWYLGYEFGQPENNQRVPGIVTQDNGRTGAYRRLVEQGRELHELHALMAPRPFLVSGGVQDRPDHWTALNHSVAVNTLLGHTGRVAMTIREGHSPTLKSNEQAFAFFEHFLGEPKTGSVQPEPIPKVEVSDERSAQEKSTVRVAAAQPKNRTIDFRLKPSDALARVELSLDELEKIVHKAGASGCDVIALPEDTLGLGQWESANKEALKDVLPLAVQSMLDRLGKAAAKHKMYLVCCNSFLDAEGRLRNTAFFLGRDGQEIGRYLKVHPTVTESAQRGDRFPVFSTTDLGGVGMLICYDMVFPESPRCLALAGADILFHPTLGGAAIGDDDISRAAFRTRAVENFVYIVVSQRGGGSMIISPQGKILVEGKGPDDIAIADIDPFGGREGSDAFNHQKDMRARLFRERNSAAYGILTDPNPPVLQKIPSTITREEAARIADKASTVGEDEYKAAESLARSGKTKEAIAAFEKLRTEYRGTWIDRVAQERLATLRASHRE